MPTVLVADDDPLTRHIVRQQLESEGYIVVEAQNGEDVMERMSAEVFVALLDINMPRLTGFDCLRHIRESYPDTQVLILTASDDVSDVVTAMKEGAFEYVLKPIRADVLVAHVRHAVNSSRLKRDNRALRSTVSYGAPLPSIVSQSPAFQSLLLQMDQIADNNSTVLLTGESGTGKTTLARMLHQQSPRRNEPFVSINCASLPRDLIETELFGHEQGAFPGATFSKLGRVEIAAGGTLFLDEIGDLPLELQPKLFAFLQERKFRRIGSDEVRHADIRLITATHFNLAELCEQNQFRQDLHQELNVLTLHVPPIRERLEDIESLANNIMERLCKRLEVAQPQLLPDTLHKMLVYSWPGNIREMENVLERAITFHREKKAIHPADIELSAAPSQAGRGESVSLAGMSLAEIEKLALQQTLAACGGNKVITAKQLGISEKSIYNKLKRHGMFTPRNNPPTSKRH